MKFQLDIYGERTARGIAGGKKVLWALALGGKRRESNSKSIIFNWDVIKDMVSLDCHWHKLEGRCECVKGEISHSQSGAGR